MKALDQNHPPLQIRERDRSNTLLANNIDTLVREERKSSINLRLVVASEERGNRKRIPSAVNNNSDFRPEKMAMFDSCRKGNVGIVNKTEARAKTQDLALEDEDLKDKSGDSLCTAAPTPAPPPLADTG